MSDAISDLDIVAPLWLAALTLTGVAILALVLAVSGLYRSLRDALDHF